MYSVVCAAMAHFPLSAARRDDLAERFITAADIGMMFFRLGAEGRLDLGLTNAEGAQVLGG